MNNSNIFENVLDCYVSHKIDKEQAILSLIVLGHPIRNAEFILHSATFLYNTNYNFTTAAECGHC
jgi:hypothetical protein